MPFLPPNQQRQSTEGIYPPLGPLHLQGSDIRTCNLCSKSPVSACGRHWPADIEVSRSLPPNGLCGRRWTRRARWSLQSRACRRRPAAACCRQATQQEPAVIQFHSAASTKNNWSLPQPLNTTSKNQWCFNFIRQHQKTNGPYISD